MLDSPEVTEPASKEQRHSIGQQITTGHPHDLVELTAQFMLDGVDTNGDNGGVDQNHEKANQHGPQRWPRLLGIKLSIQICSHSESC